MSKKKIKCSSIIDIEVQSSKEKPISEVYPEIDTDLARDNIENDIPFADLQDL